ncbi:MAG TPA: hypothetical protein VFA46_03305 [Actinomycetes bacterium]|nr:hypothetical protein [Actinomycetes bacterium]
MTDHDTIPQHAQADPPAPTPPPRTAGSRWHHLVVAGVYLGLVVWTVRLALHEQGAQGVWVTILFWMFMGPPAVIEQCDRAHGRPRPPQPHKWT